MRSALRIRPLPMMDRRGIEQPKDRSSDVKASLDWLSASSAEYQAGAGVTGYAHLSPYAVSYKEWGEGPPLILVPGLAGGYQPQGTPGGRPAAHIPRRRCPLWRRAAPVAPRRRVRLSALGG